MSPGVELSHGLTAWADVNVYVAENYIASIRIDMSVKIAIEAGNESSNGFIFHGQGAPDMIEIKVEVVGLPKDYGGSTEKHAGTTPDHREISYLANGNGKIKSFWIKVLGRIMCKDDETDKTGRLRTSDSKEIHDISEEIFKREVHPTIYTCSALLHGMWEEVNGSYDKLLTKKLLGSF